ncbi:MAG: superoxide dismutase family protein [Clostridia bacterium]|nr:superoxide dismutase family protein [Clostridia bacterium]
MFSNIFNTAKAHVKGSRQSPEIDGLVTFKETKNGVLLTAKINGLPQSKDNCKGSFFGFHIHERTSCTGNSTDEFANAKSHLTPSNCPHPFHIGDLPPLIENNGYAYMSVLINKFKIKDIIGKVIIIHDMPDDFTSQPSGNSGSKIACGKIE